MSDLSSLKIPSMRSKVSAEEWQARVDLAACYRLIALFDMNDLIYNHATARVPGSLQITSRVAPVSALTLAVFSPDGSPRVKRSPSRC